MYHKYTKELLEPVVKECYSFAEVCRKLNLQTATGNQTHLAKRIRKFEIDTSHFTGMLWSKGKILPSKRPLEDYLSNNHFITSYSLLKRLIKDEYKKAICEHCQRTEWFDEPIPLELHHKNCDHFDNTLDNLQILCPTCHTYLHRKNVQLKPKKLIAVRKYTQSKPDKIYGQCKICNNDLTNKQKSFCSIECSAKYNQRNIPTKEKLIEILQLKKSNLQTGLYFGVSDNTIKNWCQKYNIVDKKRIERS